MEDLRFDGNTYAGVVIHSTGSIIGKNQIVKTGGSTGDIHAYGIIEVGPGSRVMNNDLSEVGATTGSGVGIFASIADGVVVEGNRINNVTTPTTAYGVDMVNSSDVTVSYNRVAGVTSYGIYYVTGITGIYMNNTVSGSTRPFSGGSPAAGTNFSN